jgi:cold shock CspA family protein
MQGIVTEGLNVQGKVKRFVDSKGYGFIGRDKGPDGSFITSTVRVGYRKADWQV